MTGIKLLLRIILHGAGKSSGGRVKSTGAATGRGHSRGHQRLTHSRMTRSRAKKMTIMISSHSMRRSFTSVWTTL